MNNGNVLKKRVKENIKREKNKSSTDEKNSSNSSKKLCRMSTTKINTPPQKAIVPSDAPT